MAAWIDCFHRIKDCVRGGGGVSGGRCGGRISTHTIGSPLAAAGAWYAAFFPSHNPQQKQHVRHAGASFCSTHSVYVPRHVGSTRGSTHSSGLPQTEEEETVPPPARIVIYTIATATHRIHCHCHCHSLLFSPPTNSRCGWHESNQPPKTRINKISTNNSRTDLKPVR